MTKNEIIAKFGIQYYEDFKERSRIRNGERYRNDPEYRKAHKAQVIAHYTEHPEIRKRRNEYGNARYKKYGAYCKEPVTEIENYELALADNFEGWCVHHRYEITPNGEFMHSHKDLKRLGLYYNRPASELIWLRIKDHVNIHKVARRKLKELCGK